MRLLVLSVFGAAGALYSLAALESYQEETRARAPADLRELDGSATSRHPEANLRLLREALASEIYTDELRPYLDRALLQAPTFYQPPFLLAALYANRLEQPELVEASFEAALTRFSSNGRLHLTYAEWLSTPRASGPYRPYRAADLSSDRATDERALEHLSHATSLEPELAPQAIELLMRARVPLRSWMALLPRNSRTRGLVLHAAERMPRDQEVRRSLLQSFLAEETNGDVRPDTAILELLTVLGQKWNEAELAREASERWHHEAIDRGGGPDAVRAASALVRSFLEHGPSDRAYAVLRSTLSSLDERGMTEDAVTLLVRGGDAYLAFGQTAMAQALFTEAATRSPHRAAAYLGLANVYRRTGDDVGARRELQQVLELEPDHRTAREMLDAIREPR